MYFFKIDWDNRFRCRNGSTCLVTVDGTDFKIKEPKPFSPSWYSHKFKGAGLRYEVAICIQTGWIVWINGPFKCGEWSDRRIMQEDLEMMFLPWEKYVADKGYRDGGFKAETPDDNDPKVFKEMKASARSRHEATNKLFKDWKSLREMFRHPIHKHGNVFMAIAIITQMIIKERGPPYHVNYDDKKFL